MIEVEIYAAGVRQLEKILELDHEFETVPGLRYKVDSNHDIVYLDFEEPTLSKSVRFSANSGWSHASSARCRRS